MKIITPLEKEWGVKTEHTCFLTQASISIVQSTDDEDKTIYRTYNGMATIQQCFNSKFKYKKIITDADCRFGIQFICYLLHS